MNPLWLLGGATGGLIGSGNEKYLGLLGGLGGGMATGAIKPEMLRFLSPMAMMATKKGHGMFGSSMPGFGALPLGLSLFGGN